MDIEIIIAFHIGAVFGSILTGLLIWSNVNKYIDDKDKE